MPITNTSKVATIIHTGLRTYRIFIVITNNSFDTTKRGDSRHMSLQACKLNNSILSCQCHIMDNTNSLCESIRKLLS